MRKVFTANRMITVSLAVGAVVLMYNYGPTRSKLFERPWFS